MRTKIIKRYGELRDPKVDRKVSRQTEPLRRPHAEPVTTSVKPAIKGDLWNKA